ncbi:caspase family protein [Candidatus Pelagibacter sp.]|nr:caspase family protein [Candidatus Pelagibacter sp.]
MYRLICSIFLFLFITSFSLQTNAETSWITKKDSKKKIVKETKNETNNWIKKKEVKENKKKLKEKIKESKSWITKKSKKKLKDIKDNLKKHKDIEVLPKAEFYFAAVVKSDDGEDTYIYGYVNSDKKSSTFNFNNRSYYSKSDGIAYFENKKNRCEVDSQIGSIGSQMMGEVVLQCKENLKMIGGFRQSGEIGKGDGVTSKGEVVEFEFYTSKNKAIAKLDKYKDSSKRLRSPMIAGTTDMDLKPTGKYYALLIGNSKYVNWASLKSPVNDVTEIKKVLENQYNFEKVIPIINGTRKDIFDGIKKLSEITTDKDYVLIYYSGHGDIKSTQSYWIPIDGGLKYDPTEWINIRDIEVYLENEISAHHLAVMVDSCYFAVASKGTSKIDNKNKAMAYNKLLNRRARIILSSGSNEPVEDSVNKHSKFGFSFIQSLKNNNKTIRLYEITENIFIDHAGSRQQPYHAKVMSWGHGGGDFIFIKK